MADAERVVLVTGASGFVGSHLCPALAEAGWHVRALRSRPEQRLPSCCDPVDVSGITDRAGLQTALDGAVAVVHLAAYVHVLRRYTPRDLAMLHEVNVEGSQVIAEAAVEAGVRRLVFASSVKAVGRGGRSVWTEAMVPKPCDPYGASKLQAERAVLATCEGTGTSATILRFPLVYGPGMRANMLRFFGLIQSGLPLPIAGIGNRRSMLYVGNATAAIAAALSAGRGNGETYFVADRQALSTDELASRVAVALGRPVRQFRFPRWALVAAGRIGDLVSPFLAFPITSDAVQRLAGSLVVDASKFSRDFGFEPPYSAEEGFRATAEWFLLREPKRP